MNHIFRFVGLVLPLSLCCCSCVFNKRPADTEKQVIVDRNEASQVLDKELSAFIEEGKVRPAWQKTFATRYEKEKATAAYILVSYSGMSDRGQWALVQKNDDEFSVWRAEPNQTEKYSTKDIERSDAEKEIAVIEAAKSLKDYRRTSFDGVSYEFLILTRQGDRSDFSRIFINSLGLSDEDKSHRALVDAFNDLK
ncbi:hypothetical protein N9D31_01670 [Oligoflexaceae bacterium]|nr:hypothetical protein [Oligoflexaceae bacterium]